MHLAVEWQHVVFAQREEVDVLYNHHLIVVLLEQCIGQNLVGIHVVALGKRLHSLGHTHRCLLQSLAGRILAQQAQYLLIVIGQLLYSITILLVVVFLYLYLH